MELQPDDGLRWTLWTSTDSPLTGAYRHSPLKSRKKKEQIPGEADAGYSEDCRPPTAMKAKKQHKSTTPPADVDMQDVSEPKPRRAKKSSPKADKVARFKEEQHLKIETQDLKDGVEDGKTAPPSSSSKKRRRRSAAEIDRKFGCPFPDCTKAYGTEGSLIQHQRLKHPDQIADTGESQEKQVGTFLLPLHSASRAVKIRPATPLVTFASDPSLLMGGQSVDDPSSSIEIAPPSAKAQRCSTRLRSNSLPVTSSTEHVTTVGVIPKSHPSCSTIAKPRTKLARKPRRIATPHPKKAVTAARRVKLRSKSESLPEMAPPLPSLDELKMPANHRSDSTASHHEPIMPISSTEEGQSSFEWPSIAATVHHSTSLSRDDQAIDSDILSVLANCDAEDIGDATILDFGGPPSFHSSTSFGENEDPEMLPVGMGCFKIAEHPTLPTEAHEFAMSEPEAELGLNAFATLGDDWANALHLSKNLEKMSVTQGDPPSHDKESKFAGLPVGDGVVGRLRSASDPSLAAASMVSGLTHFSSMPASFSVKSESPFGQQPGENAVDSQQSHQSWIRAASLSDPVQMDDSNIQQLLWMSSEANVATVGTSQPSSQALDELLQHDDTLEWKAPNGFEGDADVDYGLGDAAMTSTLL